MRFQISTARDTADALEAQGIPNAYRRDVGLVDEIEDGVFVALLHETRSAMVTTHKTRQQLASYELGGPF